jgi:EmrB/QacA subfamily drug resistance transporter
MTAQASATKLLPSARWALASLSLCVLMSSLGTSIANVALPTLVEAFHASFQQVQWVVLAYLLAITTLIVSVGKIGDIIGPRRLMMAGISLFTLSSVLCAIAPALWLLIVARSVQGLGAAVMMVLALAMVGGSVPKTKTGSAIGLLGTMSAVGTALGPTLGGALIAAFGWPALFLINIPLGIVAFVLAYYYLPHDSKERKSTQGGFDAMGTLLLCLTLAAYALSMTIGQGSFGTVNVILLLTALVGVGVFVFVESRAASPLIRLELFRNLTLSEGLAISLLVTTVVMTTLVVGPFYLSGALALDAAHVGLVMSLGPIVAALMGAPAGRLTDRFGSSRMIVLGLIGMLTGSVMLPLLPTALGIPGYVAPLVLITGGYALIQAANNTAVMMNIVAAERGVISGLLNLSRNLGLITGASLMGAVFAFGSAAPQLLAVRSDLIVTGIRLTFFVAASLILVALAIAVISQSRLRRAVLANQKKESTNASV